MPLRWRHNDRDGVSNHQPRGCLLSRVFSHRWKKTSKLRVTGLCAGNSPVSGEFPAQMASNAENVSIWWRHHATQMINILCQNKLQKSPPSAATSIKENKGRLWRRYWQARTADWNGTWVSKWDSQCPKTHPIWCRWSKPTGMPTICRGICVMDATWAVGVYLVTNWILHIAV